MILKIKKAFHNHQKITIVINIKKAVNTERTLSTHCSFIFDNEVLFLFFKCIF